MHLFVGKVVQRNERAEDFISRGAHTYVGAPALFCSRDTAKRGTANAPTPPGPIPTQASAPQPCASQQPDIAQLPAKILIAARLRPAHGASTHT